MDKVKIFQVDAFTSKLFSGNPAAVCMLDKWFSDELMQSIAAENNLAETAFIVPRNGTFQIRWFTPTVEVDLCGHATLASAYVLFHCLDHKDDDVKFFSPRSGQLRVFEQNDILFLDFPTDKLEPNDDRDQIARCLGRQAIELYKGKSDYIAVLPGEVDLVNVRPDLKEIAKLPARGLIVTSKGEHVDFVSRFFAPQSGVDEDPVTGSAHTSLIPLWSAKLNKKDMTARQLSARGGDLICLNKGERCWIGGSARLYLTGEINIE
jgi:PhzF family phenazine biosynthesis protein